VSRTPPGGDWEMRDAARGYCRVRWVMVGKTGGAAAVRVAFTLTRGDILLRVLLPPQEQGHATNPTRGVLTRSLGQAAGVEDRP